MPYTYLDNIAIADVAFEADAPSREGLLREACDALTNVMVEDLASIRPTRVLDFRLSSDSLEGLLFEYLQAIIFHKDAEGLLLRPGKLSITEREGSLLLDAQAFGEKVDPGRHELGADVKAVTYHRFRVWHDAGAWHATVVLDI